MNAVLERPEAALEEALLLQFEREGKPLGRIPMVVRLNLDLCGLSFGLDDWVCLDLETRVALASRIADTDEAARMWMRMVFDCVPAARVCGIDPAELRGMDGAMPPERVNAQLQALDLPMLDAVAWQAFDTLQRYALLKLSRPGHRNRHFEKVVREVENRRTTSPSIPHPPPPRCPS